MKPNLTPRCRRVRPGQDLAQILATAKGPTFVLDPGEHRLKIRVGLSNSIQIRRRKP